MIIYLFINTLIQIIKKLLYNNHEILKKESRYFLKSTSVVTMKVQMWQMLEILLPLWWSFVLGFHSSLNVSKKVTNLLLQTRNLGKSQGFQTVTFDYDMIHHILIGIEDRKTCSRKMNFQINISLSGLFESHFNEFLHKIRFLTTFWRFTDFKTFLSFQKYSILIFWFIINAKNWEN